MPYELDSRDGWGSRGMEEEGLAEQPYVDDHLGLHSSRNRWSGDPFLCGWELLTAEKGLHPYTTLEEKQLIETVAIRRGSDPCKP